MSLSPAELLGVGPTDVVFHAGWFRYGLLALTVAWALLAGRGGRRGALLGGLVFVEAALAFWVLGLARPYGLFVDSSVTRRLAALAVATATGMRDSGPLAGEPLTAAEALLIGASPNVGIVLPTLLPLLVAALLGLLAHTLGDPARSGYPAVLWLAFSTGELDVVRGLGLLPGVWSRPGESMALVATLAAALAAARLPVKRPRAALLGAAVALVWAAVPSPDAGPSVLATLWALTLDQGAWLVLGVLGLAAGASAAAWGLTAGGGILLLASAAGAPVEAWGAHALYRLGLLLAAAGPLESGAEWVARAMAGRRVGRILAGTAPAARLGLALLILVLVPGSFLSRWNPRRLDAVYENSVSPVAPSLRDVMAWVRDHTEPDAVILAGPQRAPAVAALAGRRVLRAPTLGAAGDEERRIRLERAVITGRDVAALRRRYNLRYVVIAPGDFPEHDLLRPEDLQTHGLRLLHDGPGGVKVYAVPE